MDLELLGGVGGRGVETVDTIVRICGWYLTNEDVRAPGLPQDTSHTLEIHTDFA